MDNLPQLINITVAGGSGSADVVLRGVFVAIGIIPPSATAKYNIDITDVDGFGICGEINLTGNVTLPCRSVGHGTNTISLTLATNGAYKIKVWYE